MRLFRQPKTLPSRPDGLPLLLVFSDDWGRHPSSSQHLVGHLLVCYRVIWVNTIGMRPPRLNGATLRRGGEKLRQWLTPQRRSTTQALHPNLKIIQPLMWPWMRSRADRVLNRNLLLRQLSREINAARSPVQAITTIPIVADLMGALPVERWIYYCVDDFSVWPGLEQQAMRDMEHIVIEKADRLVAVSESLRSRLLETRNQVGLLTHGIELEDWTAENCDPTPEVFDRCPSPRVTFWGLIDQRTDVHWLQSLSESMSAGSIVLVGPEDEPSAGIRSVKRIVRTGKVAYEILPAIARESDVLIMPYADLPVTRAMQPLKLLEYLATDRSVVARDLPANRPWADCLDLADSAEMFTELVQRRIQSGLPPGQRDARRRLINESWASKAAHFRELTLSEVAVSENSLT